jgi:hypothetical protein
MDRTDGRVGERAKDTSWDIRRDVLVTRYYTFDGAGTEIEISRHEEPATMKKIYAIRGLC